LTAILWKFPAAAKVTRTVSKSKIYQHGKLNQAVKDKFVHELSRIEWAYKLASNTVNLASSDAVPEIQVFRLYLKDEQLSTEVLSTIDAAIPFPILFELIRPDEESDGSSLCYRMCYKTPKISAKRKPADQMKWQCSFYLHSEWINPDSLAPTPLPAVASLTNLYHYFLAEMASVKLDVTEDISQILLRVEQLNKLDRKIRQLENKQRREKQYNLRVEINQEIKSLKKEADRLRV